MSDNWCNLSIGYITLGPDSTVEVMTDRSFGVHTQKRTFFMYSDDVDVRTLFVLVGGWGMGG